MPQTQDPQTLSMLHHPELRPFLIERGFALGRGFGRELNLAALLNTLQTFGVVALTMAAAAAERERSCICSLTTDWCQPLSADGHSRELACLRCLMETLAEMRRLASQRHDELADFLADF
jgi:hypothetical protein